jgi:transcription elongation factor GreA
MFQHWSNSISRTKLKQFCSGNGGVAKGDPGEAVSIQAPWTTFYGARNNELLHRKIGNGIRIEVMESIPISQEGYERIKQELERLKSERPEIIQAIKEAREEGDLSENAGYEAARERQGMLEAKISYIESRMPNFNIIDMRTVGGNKVVFGATVRLCDLDTEAEREYTLVGPDETDFIPREKGAISVLSPVGRALLGKGAGDEVVVNVPRGKITYEIMEVSFKGSVLGK